VRDLEANIRGLVEALSKHLAGYTEENHEKTSVRMACNPVCSFAVMLTGSVLTVVRISYGASWENRTSNLLKRYTIRP
jgi:hypothetical protein